MLPRCLLSLIVLTAVLFTDFKNETTPEAVACEPPATVVAQAPCENGYQGTLLVASACQTSTSTQFEYQVFLQKDTLSNDISNAANKWGNASIERIIVPDAVLKDTSKFIVQISMNCRTGKRPSTYFAFVKRPTANSGCFVCAQQIL